MRKEIESLNKEREIFDNIYSRLENDLEKRKIQMASVIENANLAY